MKQMIRISVLCVLLLLFTGCKNSSNSHIFTENPTSAYNDTITIAETITTEPTPLDLLNVDLPSGITSQRISDDEIVFLDNSRQVGGIFLIQINASVFEDILNSLTALEPIILDAIKEITHAEWEWYGGNSSVYGLYEFNVGDSQSEYIAYVLRGYTTCYVFWFDRMGISYETETAIMESLHSTDIPEELNMVSNEDYMDAVSESMAKEEYYFTIELPNEITREDTSDTSAFLYRNQQIIGGYHVVHFEKGILPAVQDNHDTILTYLQENVMEDISDSMFTAQIIDERLITAVFSNEFEEYTHFLLPFGQVGTQYDLWFNTKLLDNQTMQSILWSAGLKQIS